jgi:hypothetical protein
MHSTVGTNAYFTALLLPHKGPGELLFVRTPKDSSPLFPELLWSHGDPPTSLDLET